MKYKLNINKPVPEEQEIQASKNFNRVLRQYREKKQTNSLHNTLSKLNKQLPVIIITVLMILVAFYFSRIMRKLEKISPKNSIEQKELKRN